MTTLFNELCEENKETLRQKYIPMFFGEECHAFAIALNRGLGWPIVWLMNGTVVHHVAVRSPEGLLYNAQGAFSEKELSELFSPSLTYSLCEITEVYLPTDEKAQRVREHRIAQARKFAETLWPELDWLESRVSKVKAFIDELETLSRKHKVWIRSPYSELQAVVEEGEGNELGYRLEEVLNGFTINLRIKE
ncbi:MAG: hypothetical protein WD509_03400 [Candidatus Paceibacterota bacterium]